MQFLQKDIILRLVPSKIKTRYIKSTSSKTSINGIHKNQFIEHDIDVGIALAKSGYFEVNIDSKLKNIALDSTLKKQELLSKKLTNITSCLQLQLNNTEYKKITNYNQILSKWNMLQDELKQKYTGKIFENYVYGLNKRFSEQESLLKNINQLRGFGLFWMIPFGPYNKDNKYKCVREIDQMVDKLPVKIDETIQLKSFNDSTVSFAITGVLADNQKYEKKISNYFKRLDLTANSQFNVNYSGECSYSLQTGLINHCSLEIQSSYGAHYIKTQNYTLNKTESVL